MGEEAGFCTGRCMTKKDLSRWRKYRCCDRDILLYSRANFLLVLGKESLLKPTG